MRESPGLKGNETLLGTMVVTGLAHSEGEMAEQKHWENWVHWEEVHLGDEQLVYDCCDPHDRRNIVDSRDGSTELLVAVVRG